jgi:hypothetical protein
MCAVRIGVFVPRDIVNIYVTRHTSEQKLLTENMSQKTHVPALNQQHHLFHFPSFQ